MYITIFIFINVDVQNVRLPQFSLTYPPCDHEPKKFIINGARDSVADAMCTPVHRVEGNEIPFVLLRWRLAYRVVRKVVLCACVLDIILCIYTLWYSESVFVR